MSADDTAARLAEARTELAQSHAYYCTHAPVQKLDELIVEYLLQQPALEAAVDKIVEERAQQRLAAALRAVLAIHINDRSGQAAPATPGMCEVCMWAWPCPTVRAVTTAAVDGAR